MNKIKSITLYNLKLTGKFQPFPLIMGFNNRGANFITLVEDLPNESQIQSKAILLKSFVDYFLQKPSSSGKIMINGYPLEHLYAKNYNICNFQSFYAVFLEEKQKNNKINWERLISHYLNSLEHRKTILTSLKDAAIFDYYYLLWNTNGDISENELASFKKNYQKVYVDNYQEEQIAYGEYRKYSITKMYAKSFKNKVKQDLFTTEEVKKHHEEYLKLKTLVRQETVSNFRNPEFQNALRKFKSLTIKGLAEEKNYKKLLKKLQKNYGTELRQSIKKVQEELANLQKSMGSLDEIAKELVRKILEEKYLKDFLFLESQQITKEILLEIFMIITSHLPFNIVFLDDFFDTRKLRNTFWEAVHNNNLQRIIFSFAEQAKNLLAWRSYLLVIQEDGLKLLNKLVAEGVSVHPKQAKFAKEISSLDYQNIARLKREDKTLFWGEFIALKSTNAISNTLAKKDYLLAKINQNDLEFTPESVNEMFIHESVYINDEAYLLVKNMSGNFLRIKSSRYQSDVQKGFGPGKFINDLTFKEFKYED